jgi:RNA polymerase sigma factor (sigma-70 family)
MLKITSDPKSQLSEVGDSDLIKKIQVNSIEETRTEINAIYQRHANSVYRMTRSLFDSSPEGIQNAEDLFQEAWRIGLERITAYDSQATTSFSAWIKGIADNLFLENLRASEKKEIAISELSYLTSSTEEDSMSDEPDSDEVLTPEGLIRKEKLLAALHLLSDQEKEILIEWHRTYDRNNPGRPEHAENLERLCLKFGFQKDTIRKIKQRAVEKIQGFIRI